MGCLAITIDADRIEARVGEHVARGPFSPPLAAGELDELAWYMETDLRRAFGPDRDRVAQTAAALPALGARLGAALEPNPAMAGVVGRALASAPSDPPALSIAADDPLTLALPWELASWDDERGRAMLAELGEITRAPSGGAVDVAAAEPLPGGPLRVLMVSPRPRREDDVPLTPTLGTVAAAACAQPDRFALTVVRPPTVGALRRAVEDGPYDVVHFDGHGVMPSGDEVRLWFERDGDDEGTVSGEEFARLVAPARPRIVFMNACRSAFVSDARLAPSVASAVAAALPGTEVLAMRFAVTPTLVETLVSIVYPLLAESRSASRAVLRARHALLRAWRDAGSELVPPDFLNLHVLGSPRRTAPAGAPVPRAAARPRAAPAASDRLLHWFEKVLELEHAVLASERPIVLAGPLGSGKSSLARAFADYATATGLCEATALAPDLRPEPDAAPPDAPAGGRARLRVLRVVDRTGSIGPGELAGAASAQAPGTRLLICSRGLAESRSVERVAIGEPPIPLVSAALAPLRDRGLSDAELFELSLAGGSHLGTLAALIDALAHESPAAAVEDLRWGADPAGALFSDEVDGVLRGLAPEQLRVASVLALYEGWVLPNGLTMLTAGGLRDDAFRRLFGRWVDAAEWSSLLDALQDAGLVVRHPPGDPGAPAQVPPIVGRALRAHLAAWAGPAGSERLQGDMARATAGLVHHLGELATWRGDDVSEWQARALKDRALVVAESSVLRAMRHALRTGDDELATHLVAPYFGASPAGSDVFGRGLGIVDELERSELGDESGRPRLRALAAAARAALASSREQWPVSLREAERALGLGVDLRAAAFPTARLLIVCARACWRLGRYGDAEAMLREALEGAQTEQERAAVSSACSDMAQYLQLDAAERLELRARVGIRAVSPGPQAAAYEAEAAGRVADAYAYWLEHLRSTQLEGDAVAAAFARTELGRLCALHGRTDEARAWLQGALEQRGKLELDLAPPLYYLGMAAEVDDDLDAAEGWLRHAIAAAGEGRDTSPTLRADCSYQLGIVLLKRGQLDAARASLSESLEMYAELGRDRYRCDAHLLLAQAEAERGEHAAAREHLRAAAPLAGDDPQRLEMVRAVAARLAGT